MGKLFVMLVGLVVLGSAPTGFAGEAGAAAGCQPQGTWLGFDTNGVAQWMSSIFGSSSASGTNTLELPAFDLTLGGAFPDAVQSTNLRGVWERINGNTFHFTMLGIVADEFGATQWVIKLSGTNTLLDGCSKEYVENVLEVFLPNMNPLEDSAYFAIPLPGHYGYRVSVDPPAL